MLFPEGTTVTEVVEFIKNPVVVNEFDREEIDNVWYTSQSFSFILALGLAVVRVDCYTVFEVREIVLQQIWEKLKWN